MKVVWLLGLALAWSSATAQPANTTTTTTTTTSVPKKYIHKKASQPLGVYKKEVTSITHAKKDVVAESVPQAAAKGVISDDTARNPAAVERLSVVLDHDEGIARVTLLPAAVKTVENSAAVLEKENKTLQLGNNLVISAGNFGGITNILSTLIGSNFTVTVGSIGSLLSNLFNAGIGTGTIGGIGLGTVFAPLGGLFTLAAGAAAGLFALIALAVKGLQIANQILAIIGIALLGAYLSNDKEDEEDDYYEVTGSSYGQSGGGYGDSGGGYGYGPTGGIPLSGSGGGYGSGGLGSSGLGASGIGSSGISSSGIGASGIGSGGGLSLGSGGLSLGSGGLGSGTGASGSGSSYSDYRRAGMAGKNVDGFSDLYAQQGLANSLDDSSASSFFQSAGLSKARSLVSPSLINRVGRLLNDAVHKYAEMNSSDSKRVTEVKEKEK